MSEIRDELEYYAQLAEAQAAAEETEKENEVKSAAAEEGDDEYLNAPESYQKEYAETFAKLPKEWRRYLHTREQEIDKGFSELCDCTGADKWLEKTYASRADALKSYGIKSKADWLNTMVNVDAMLSSHPADAIKMLAELYQVDVAPAASSAARGRGQSLNQVLQDRIMQSSVDDFKQEQDANGNLKHPYFNEVVKEMSALLAKGVVENIGEAYDMAVWLNRATRDKLVAQRSQEALELKSKNAQKSKSAGFSLKGKAVPDTKDLTLREELEMRFAALGIDD